MLRHPAHRQHDAARTRGERIADATAAQIGSWHFLIGQACAFAVWIAVNALAVTLRWDPYPFILLNLMLSFQAAFTGPLLLLASNRQAARDREQAASDYAINREALELLRRLSEHAEPVGLTTDEPGGW